MTSTLSIPKAKPTPVTDAWVAVTWDEFLAVIQFEKAGRIMTTGSLI